MQTTGQMAHDFDSEEIIQAEKRHKERFATLVRQIRYGYPDCLPMGTGPVPCAESAPIRARCRHPERMFISMEGYGLLVNDVAKASGLRVRLPGTITFPLRY